MISAARPLKHFLRTPCCNVALLESRVTTLEEMAVGLLYPEFHWRRSTSVIGERKLGTKLTHFAFLNLLLLTCPQESMQFACKTWTLFSEKNKAFFIVMCRAILNRPTREGIPELLPSQWANHRPTPQVTLRFFPDFTNFRRAPLMLAISSSIHCSTLLPCSFWKQCDTRKQLAGVWWLCVGWV